MPRHAHNHRRRTNKPSGNPHKPTDRQEAIVELCRDVVFFTACRVGADGNQALDDAAAAANYMLHTFLDAHVSEVQLGEVSVIFAGTVRGEAVVSEMTMNVTPFGWTVPGDAAPATILALWAMSLATGNAAAIASRHIAPNGTSTVRAWVLRGDAFEPLGKDDVSAVFNPERLSGIMRPDKGVRYADGFPVPFDLEPDPAR